MNEEQFLQTLKTLLVKAGILTEDIVLDRRSWLDYFYEGLDPYSTCKMEFGLDFTRLFWKYTIKELNNNIKTDKNEYTNFKI